MQISGFKDSPISRLLVFGLVTTSLLATITDTKFYFHLDPSLHISRYGQYWRIITWQICYTNSTELLFAAMTFYQLRVIERLWGSRKFASFVVMVLGWSSVVTPIVLVAAKFLSRGYISYLPAGPTVLLFALLAQYHVAIPPLYTYRVGVFSPPPSSDDSVFTSSDSGTITLTSKSTGYFLPLQLALSQFPNALLPAVVGWVLGMAWRNEILVGASWRVPGWVVGESGGRDARRVEALRRRMEESDAVGSSSGIDRGI